MFDARELRKKFHRGTVNERVALDGVDLKLDRGEFAVIVGGNGAGKSTLLNAVAGEIRVDSGAVVIDGAELTGMPTHKRARWIARVFQDPMLGTASDMTIEENLAVAELRGLRRGLRPNLTRARRDDFRGLLALLGLGLENRLTTKVGLLSGGQRQALALLMAVVRRPLLLLLDEHTAALDPRTADVVMTATLAAIKDCNLTTLMVTHNLQHALRYGDRLVMLKEGRKVLDMSGKEKQAMTVETLIGRFGVSDDRLALG